MFYKITLFSNYITNDDKVIVLDIKDVDIDSLSKEFDNLYLPTDICYLDGCVIPFSEDLVPILDKSFKLSENQIKILDFPKNYQPVKVVIHKLRVLYFDLEPSDEFLEEYKIDNVVFYKGFFYKQYKVKK